ncbi:MAG: hypothetical protein KDC12_12085, partial [Flavobacteriales bacterium]|nr:hypothetical protein [Flavobacteriales bacterium]
MRHLILLASFLFSAVGFRGQDITWTEHIAPMIYENCSHCHREVSVAPFPLLSYDDVDDHALSMYFAMEERHMPPWPADPDYRHFLGETVLTDQQIADFLTWIESGKPYGDPDLEPLPPIFNDQGSVLGSVDYTFEIEPYTLQYNTDETRWFVIDPGFEQTVYINKIEVIPDPQAAAHHIDISLDLTSTSMNYDSQDPLPGFNSSTGAPNYSYYMNAWQPGAGPAIYPENWGIEVPPGAHFVMEVHYGPGFAETIDHTKINFEFVENVEEVRPVHASWMLGTFNMTNGPLYIPANTSAQFYQQTASLSSPLSLIAICPHMHLIGREYEVWFETWDGIEVPLISIPQWDFHWQFYYYFEQIQMVPAGAKIHGRGLYDNSEDNPYNPNNPPIDVWNGPNTTDEMFLCYFIHANYEEGDENLSVEWVNVGVDEPSNRPIPEWDLHPNPANTDTFITGFVGSEDLTVEITSISGECQFY